MMDFPRRIDNPVVADITIFDTDTEEYKKQGKSVFQENIR